MNLDFFNQFPTFYLGEHDRFNIDGWVARYVGNNGAHLEFMDASVPLVAEVFDIGDFNRLNAAGKIKHDPGYFLHKLDAAAVVRDYDSESISGLNDKHRARVESRYAMVRVYFDLREAGILKVNDDDIADAMPKIRLLAEEYMVAELPDPKFSEQFKQWKAGNGPKPSAMGMVQIPAACSPRTLRGWAASFRKFGKKGLMDNVAKQGNIHSYFSADETALMMQVIRDSYLVTGHPPLSKALTDLRRAFAKENGLRNKEGRPLLRTPGRDAVRGAIKKMDKFFVRVQRYGAKEAMRKMRAVKSGLTHTRPLERCEMDEWKIDLFTIMAHCRLFELFSEVELEALGLLDQTRRWWLVVTIDCRTRVILGMVLTCNPKASAAISCLQMVVSDKGEIANSAGAKSPWNMFGKPEVLATDNGSAFKSQVFSNACADLGIHGLQTIAGSPSMRGPIERVFRTASTMLLPNLSGRSFSNSVEKGDYDGEKRACLSMEDLCQILVRWIVDVYHNTPHQGLCGATPLQQWQADMAAGNYPLHAAPTIRQKRLAFGIHTTRKVQTNGIRVLHVQYHSERLAGWFLKHGSEAVEVRWTGDDIGQIEAKLDGAWFEIEATERRFDGVDAHVWVATMRALRMKYAKKLDLTDAVIFAALDDIEALNADRKLSYRLLDKGMGEKYLKALEREAKGGFAIIPAQAQLTTSSDGFGHSIAPITPEKPTKAKTQRDGADKQATRRNKWIPDGK